MKRTIRVGQWRVSIKENILKFLWSETSECWVYLSVFWVLASNGRSHYIHFYQFGENYGRADRMLRQIAAKADFSPEDKPKVWIPITDVKEVRQRPSWLPKEYRWLRSRPRPQKVT